jgi:hypothetical protein
MSLELQINFYRECFWVICKFGVGLKISKKGFVDLLKNMNWDWFL